MYQYNLSFAVLHIFFPECVVETQEDTCTTSGGAMITVEILDEQTFKVTVTEKSTTVHTVSVEPSYYRKLTGGRVSVVELVEKSFEFLLKRESNTQILSRFDLPVIGHYFPEYEENIKKKTDL